VSIILIILRRRHQNHLISSQPLIRFRSNFNYGIYAKSVPKIQRCDRMGNRGRFSGIQHLGSGSQQRVTPPNLKHIP